MKERLLPAVTGLLLKDKCSGVQLPLTQALQLLPKEIDGELMCPLSVSHRNSMTSATGWYKILLTFSPTMPTLNEELCLKRQKHPF